MRIFDMHDNRHKFTMPPKSIVMNKISDIGVSNDLYYSRNLFAKSIFRGRVKCALNLVNPLNKTVLDVGCGAGFMAYNLSANGARTVACDLRTKLKKSNLVLNDLLTDSKIEFGNADIFHLPFKRNSFDIIYALDMLEHLYDVDIALVEIKRVLKDNGFLIVSIPNENIFYRIGRKIIRIKKANHVHDSTGLIQLLNELFTEAKSISVPLMFNLFYIKCFSKKGVI